MCSLLCVIPSNKGHFSNYIEIIENYSSSHVSILELDSLSAGFKKFYKIFCQLKKSDSIIFMHGDKDILLAIIFKIFFRKKNIKSILYYSFYTNFSIKNNIREFFIYFSSLIGVKNFLLEGVGIEKKRNYLFNLIDPCLLKHESFPPYGNVDRKVYLIAGYLDERKCIEEVVTALDLLCNIDGSIRELVLLGQQDLVVTNFILDFNPCSNLIITVLNKRFRDAELQYNLLRADVVVCLYKNHFGSSGMVLNSLLYKKPVIFNAVGYLKYLAEEIEYVSFPDVEIYDSFNKFYFIENYLINNNCNYSISKSQSFVRKRTAENFFSLLLGS